MKIEVMIDETCPEPKIIIMTDKMNDEIEQLVKRINDETPLILSGFQEDRLKILHQKNIVRIYAVSGKVFAKCEDGEFMLKLRLYEIEKRLDRSSFVRISHSEIINLKKVKNFDLSLTGTICVTFCNGDVSYVSRRYVSKIKQVLGI